MTEIAAINSIQPAKKMKPSKKQTVRYMGILNIFNGKFYIQGFYSSVLEDFDIEIIGKDFQV